MGLHDTIPASLPRWTYDSSGNQTAEAAEAPATQLRTTGWLPGRPSRKVMNWLLGRTYAWLGYLDASLRNLFDDNFVMRGQAAGAGAVVMTSNGSPSYTFDVDVAEAKVWLEGAAYLLPAATLTANPVAGGNERYDYVVGTPTGWAILEGTEAAVGAAVVPTLGDDQVAVASWRMTQQETADISVDERERGVLLQARIGASRLLRAGLISGTDFLLDVDADAGAVQLRGDVDLGSSGALTGTKDVALTLAAGSTLAGDVNVTGQLTVNPAFGVAWTAAQLKTRKLSPHKLRQVYTSFAPGADTSAVAPLLDGTVQFHSNPTGTARAWAPLDNMPDGATVTQVVVRGRQSSTNGGVVVGRIKENTGSPSTLTRDSATSNATVNHGDAFTITIDVDSDWVADHSGSILNLELTESTNNDMDYYIDDIEVWYTTAGLTPQ